MGSGDGAGGAHGALHRLAERDPGHGAGGLRDGPGPRCGPRPVRLGPAAAPGAGRRRLDPAGRGVGVLGRVAGAGHPAGSTARRQSGLLFRDDPAPWLERFASFPVTLAYHPPQLAIALAGLVLVPWAWSRRELVHPPAIILWTGAACSLVLVAFVRPGAYTYFGATLFLFNALFALGFSRFVAAPSPDLRRAGWVAVAVCVAISGRSLVAHVWYASRLPDAERPGLAAQSVRAIVPAGDLVAVTPRHWHAFQGRNPWRDAFLAALSERC